MLWSSPANSVTKRCGSGWFCSDSAANRRPAAQPSVRACSRARSSSDSLGWGSQAASRSATSGVVNARSASRSWANCPLIRSRWSGSGGSTRVASTRRNCAGAWRNRNASPWSTPASVSSWTSSRISTTGVDSSARPVTSWGRNVVWGPARGASDRRLLLAGTAPDRHSAARAYAQKRAGSLSPGSSESQTTGPGRLPSALQAASSVVFPAPAGADTSVSSCCAPSSSWASSRGRETTRSGMAGAVVLVASSGSSASVASWSGRRRVCGRGRGRDVRPLPT